MQNWTSFRTSVQFVQTAEFCKMLDFSIFFAVVDWITMSHFSDKKCCLRIQRMAAKENSRMYICLILSTYHTNLDSFDGDSFIWVFC